jgi:hypothetical protein
MVMRDTGNPPQGDPHKKQGTHHTVFPLGVTPTSFILEQQADDKF